MSDEKRLKARVVHKHKTEAEWYLDVYDAATGEKRSDPFIPLNGELIIFDADENNEKKRFKFGDGVTDVISLEFSDSSVTSDRVELEGSDNTVRLNLGNYGVENGELKSFALRLVWNEYSGANNFTTHYAVLSAESGHINAKKFFLIDRTLGTFGDPTSWNIEDGELCFYLQPMGFNAIEVFVEGFQTPCEKARLEVISSLPENVKEIWYTTAEQDQDLMNLLSGYMKPEDIGSLVMNSSYELSSLSNSPQDFVEYFGGAVGLSSIILMDDVTESVFVFTGIALSIDSENSFVVTASATAIENGESVVYTLIGDSVGDCWRIEKSEAKVPHITTTDDSLKVNIGADGNERTELNIEKDKFNVSSVIGSGEGSHINVDSNDVDIYTDTSIGSASISLSDNGSITARAVTWNSDGESPEANLKLEGEGLDIDFKSEFNYTGKLEANVEHIYFTQDSSSGNTSLNISPSGVSLTSGNTNGYSEKLNVGPGEAYIDIEDISLRDHSRLELDFNGLIIQTENRDGSLIDFKIDAAQVKHNGNKLLTTKDYITAGQKPNTPLGAGATAEGSGTISSGFHSHAEGANSEASGNQSHAEGNGTLASGDQAHAEGYETEATAAGAHAEGLKTLADNDGAHAQGKFTKATGDASAANGYWTTAESSHQFVIGHANDNKGTNLFEVGGGAVYYDKDTDTFIEDEFDRFNVFEVSHDGYAGAERIATKDTIFNRKEGTVKDGVEYARWHNGPTGKVDPIVIPGAVASGFQSVAFGGQRIDKTLKAYKKDPQVPAEEPQTQALGDQSFAAGGSVIVNGDWSAGFGKETITYQKAAFAMGGGTRAGCTEEEYTKYATVQRDDTSAYAASYSLSVAEGELTKALGRTSHAEGRYGLTTGIASHVEGNESVAIGKYSHAEGWQTKTGTFTGNNKTGEIVIVTSGNAAHAEGRNTTASADYAHAEGTNTVASSTASHAEGNGSVAQGQYSHAEGTSKASNECAHAEGKGTTASGVASHTEGEGTTATHANAHAEGYSTDAINENAHAEGKNSIASGVSSHAEGDSTKAAGLQAHAEGAKTNAAGNNSHTEGYQTLAKGVASHAEGYSTADLTNKYDASSSDGTIKTDWETNKNFGAAVGQGSHAEGLNTLAYGRYSHAGGSYSEAVGNNSFAHGDHVTASAANQAVFGKYNALDSNALFIIGNGDATTPKNAFKVNKDNSITLGNTTFTETQLIKILNFIESIEG